MGERDTNMHPSPAPNPLTVLWPKDFAARAGQTALQLDHTKRIMSQTMPNRSGIYQPSERSRR